jgi:hypothetical protein
VSTNDPIKHPAHYTSHPSGVECIEIAMHEPYCIGAALKYIWRRGQKGDAVEDLRKAITYLEFEIARLEVKEETR